MSKTVTINDFETLSPPSPNHKYKNSIFVLGIISIIFSVTVIIILLGMLANKLKIKKVKK